MAGILAAFSSLFYVSKDTVVEEFFRWIFLGGVMDFVLSHYALISAVLISIMLVRYIRNWKILLAIFALIFVFFAYILKV
jgi:hypothetical protein